MRVLVACEYSGRVRDAFIRAGHEAVSCDLLPTDSPGPHYHGDVRNVINDGWDLMIAHPPCTHLAVSGARWFHLKQQEQKDALDFVRLLLAAKIPKIALENPISIISSEIKKPTQIIQPWMFGHWETKATCLWLKNLPPLVPTFKTMDEYRTAHKLASNSKPAANILKMPPSKDRRKKRSITYTGIAEAFALQWGI